MSDPCASIVAQLKSAEADKAKLQQELAGAGGGKAGIATLIKEDIAKELQAQRDLQACRLKMFEAKHAELGGDAGVLGPRTSSATECTDGVGWFCTFANGVIFWSPESDVHEVHGKILAKWTANHREQGPLGYPTSDQTATVNGHFGNFQSGVILLESGADEAFEVQGAIHVVYVRLGREKGFLGYPITDETVAPDSVGHFNRFEHGVIFSKPTVSAHEVHGPIRNLWQSDGGEDGHTFGYPIANTLPVAPGSADTYSDFEDGVIFLGHGASVAAQLPPFITKSRAEVESVVKSKVHDVLTAADSQIYVTKPAQIVGVTDYSVTTNGVRNRMLSVAVSFGITVAGTNDPDVDLKLDIEIRLDRPSKSVQAVPRSWGCKLFLDWPTNWATTTTHVYNELKPKIDAVMNVPVHVMDVPSGIDVLSVKVMRDGSVSAFVQA